MLVAGGVTGNLTLQSAEVIDPVTHAFTSLGNMQSGRNQHTATLLDNGKVLIAAGSLDTVPLKSAEVFDPANNTFSSVGSLAVVRKSHTATKLQDGRVLITGGKSPIGYLSSCEIYDPASRFFQTTSSLATVRALHTATLLNDGKVLVVGGVTTGGVPTPTAELFNPLTETFSSTGSLALQRKRHRATLLLDGNVLVSGGNYLANSEGGGDRETDTVELYDTVSGSFSDVQKMHAPRSEHESTLLSDGNVMICGGSTAGPSDLYDPATQTFTAIGQMVETRGRHVALQLINPAWGTLVGKVLAIGGDVPGGEVFGGGQQAIGSVELFDPASNQFSLFGQMTVERQNHTATELLDGRILITGGVGRPFVSGTAELVTP